MPMFSRDIQLITFASCIKFLVLPISLKANWKAKVVPENSMPGINPVKDYCSTLVCYGDWENGPT